MPVLSFRSVGPGRSPRTRWRVVASAGIVPWALLLPVAFGCGDQSLRPAALPDQADLYWKLELNHHAVVLSTTTPYDTLQLIAEPRNYRDEPLAGLPAARYMSTDPEHVIVTDNGILVAVAVPAQPVAVIATLTAGNLKHTDTVSVNVVDKAAPPVLASFSIRPVPPDSAKISAGGASPTPSSVVQVWDTIPARAAAIGGESIPIFSRDSDGYLPVFFRSADTTIAVIQPPTAQGPSGQFAGTSGVLAGIRPGTVQVYASTTAFGRRMTDTSTYRIGEPVLALVSLSTFGDDSTIVILTPNVVVGAGGAVAWAAGAIGVYDSTAIVDITFSDADVPNVQPIRPVIDQITHFNTFAPYIFCAFDCDNGGNFVLTKSQMFVARHFPVPGTYEYHSAKLGQSGRIVVVDER